MLKFYFYYVTGAYVTILERMLLCWEWRFLFREICDIEFIKIKFYKFIYSLVS